MARVRRVTPDEQLTLVEHLDELRSRIIVILAVLVVSMTGIFIFSDPILSYLKDPIGRDTQFLQTSPLDALMTSISISIYGGLLITLPVLTYQLYSFVLPAFPEEHHRPIKIMAMFVPCLFVIGALFGWFLVVPPALDFLLNYNADQFNFLPRAKEYIQFIGLTLLAMGVVFEMPVVMMTLARVGLVTSARMRQHWRLSIVGLAVIAMLLPGVDPISYIVEFVPLLVLYGLSYFLVKLVEPKNAPQDDPEPTLT
jgi:sec-independent protein translocase protein TatC